MILEPKKIKSDTVYTVSPSISHEVMGPDAMILVLYQEKSQINNLTLHLKQLEKEEMKNPRVSRRKDILKIRAEINAKETKETIAKINKAKSWFFEKINKID